MKLLLLLALFVLFRISNPQGQPADRGAKIALGAVKNVLGGSYAQNVTLYFRNSPYRIEKDLIVEKGVTLTIETGTQLLFDTGAGLIVHGTIRAIGNEFAHIQMLPYNQNFDDEFVVPRFRLIDGPTVKQGRLQVQFRDRWRSVCTQLTNWTSVDFTVACKSMGYGDGGFWKWFRRNNDTFPAVVPRPDCPPMSTDLFDCPGLADENRIAMSENLCQGEDDIGIVCWGPPTFSGWSRHWKGLQIYNSPFGYVNADPDGVAVQRESASRLEFIDILFAGYDGRSKNATPALYIEGVPPLINGLRIERSARDGVYFYQPSGPILIANSTFSFNRGHGIAIDNTTDGRAFINYTRIEGNLGDGIWYRQEGQGSIDVDLIDRIERRNKRQMQITDSLYQIEAPQVEICENHSAPSEHYFPYLLRALLKNGSYIDPLLPSPCWIGISLPPQLPYTYSLQFLNIRNRNMPDSETYLRVCESHLPNTGNCALELSKIPILNARLPQSISIRSSGRPIILSLHHKFSSDLPGYVLSDVDVIFRVHASVMDKAYYGLNVTHSIIHQNLGNGIEAWDVRDRTALTNVTITENQGLAGFLVRDGAADIWINETRIDRNWGDGLNVSYAGGSITVNGTSIRGNRWRGAAFHFNESSPFIAMHQEIVFKGRPANNMFYMPTIVSENLWGGILVGNFCFTESRRIEPKVLISWVEMQRNLYHPALEIFSCQFNGASRTIIDITGNRIERNGGMGLRILPHVNMHTIIASNLFMFNNDTALLIKNSAHPQLSNLYANANISKNAFKFNQGQYIVNIGLNEDAPNQRMMFNQQNEIRENRVFNPFPHLPPRSTPYAAVVVSSSNVVLHRNCFKNPAAEFEIGTELSEHAKVINATENNWGTPSAPQFLRKIFDQFYRYSLASIEIDPYSSVCNQRSPHMTRLQEHIRHFQTSAKPFKIGGTVYENHDLPLGRYTVTDDLHITPGARLGIASGSSFEFAPGVGVLVEGEMLVAEDYNSATFGSNQRVVFTAAPFELQMNDKVRLIDEDGSDQTTEGRLEVFVDGEWGTVCNRSWTAHHALTVCNQLGLVMDPEYFENWRIFPSAGDLPMLMDNIRCEENEVDITRCRFDGQRHNVGAGCRKSEVVGIRCVPPRWAGVRYSLLANPYTVTGQPTMSNWLIEKAGLFDFRTPQFAAALQIDWNYHTFNNLEISNNFWNGIDVVYNDLMKKPTIRNAVIRNNRRHGIRLRSNGITIENVTITGSGFAGIHYNSKVSMGLQRDIVSWLDPNEQPDQEANNIFAIPSSQIDRLEVMASSQEQRKFLVAVPTNDCPLVTYEECAHEIMLTASGFEYGLSARLAIQIVNPASNASDEDALITDPITNKVYSVRKNQIEFPITSRGNQMRLRYTRSHGMPKMVLLVLFLDSQEYLDRFVHVHDSRIDNNQYAISSTHYNNLTLSDGTFTNRWSYEKIWFQKVNFTRNKEAVLWINSPQHEVKPGTPMANIIYHIDNCSLHHNTGPLVETHWDLFASANVFHWNFWSNTFANNTNGGVSVRLPDPYDVTARQQGHTFLMTENRFETNEGLRILVDGFHCWANISSNNFTDNMARYDSGIYELAGMEKDLIMERNRFLGNWGHWMVKMNMHSQSTRNGSRHVPAIIQYNYFQGNKFVQSNQDYVDMWPRSYAIGVFGTQRADVHFNRLSNRLMDFELVTGCTPIRVLDSMNVTHNWFGSGNDAEVAQRIFDLDDWNIYTLADYSPFYTSEELFINFWWNPKLGQLAYPVLPEPSGYDLKGRMFKDKTLKLEIETWPTMPFYNRPIRPYRITRDLTIMPGATLTIERGVEVHIWPNVRILVLGNLVADATYWEPVRFKPINVTEYEETRGRERGRYKRSIDRARPDPVYASFPQLYRYDPYYQKFSVHLNTEDSKTNRAGWLEIYNATSGEIVPLCDRQFTIRNAQVACRELGYPTQNAYQWVTARWEYNPKVHILKTYTEPRECRGDEPRLEKCPLRFSGNTSQWQCMDNEHFNYIYCAPETRVNKNYIGSWGGIVFANDEVDQTGKPAEVEKSVLKHVEIVGGGHAHNDSYQGGALLIFHRSPIIEAVNVTNSSMNGIEIVNPSTKVILVNVNVTDNNGKGISIVTANLQGHGGEPPQVEMSLPYFARGFVDMCASTKKIVLHGRILLYYKYDARPVDCVKVFSGEGKTITFRLLQVNLYASPTDLGRSDALRVFSSEAMEPSTLLAKYGKTIDGIEQPDLSPFNRALSVNGPLALHFRGTAADPSFGFIAEIAITPTPPDFNLIDEVVIASSRLDNNDRGALRYENTGEISPHLVIEDCSMFRNGLHLYGNISTTLHSAMFSLHNTQLLLFRGNSLGHNRGGLLIDSKSESAVARLMAIVKNNLFVANSNSTTIELLGNGYQKVTMLNNVISHNYAYYFDTVLAHDVIVNMTRNTIFNNTGLHTIDIRSSINRVSSENHAFLRNNIEHNFALGHGHQYLQRYGFQPGWTDEFDLYKRPKRQISYPIFKQDGVSFDWWTHVYGETDRYRSTIYGGSSRQHYENNVFNNPENELDLTTSNRSAYDVSSVDARRNYWGWPSTDSVAAGRIRDESDLPYLIRVDYSPVLESNTSLIEGDCPAGWFQVGDQEFKSCYLYVGAASTYERAQQYCEELGSFLIYLYDDDYRQKDLARRVEEIELDALTEAERQRTMLGARSEIKIWVGSAAFAWPQCGYLSARTTHTHYENCQALRPFLCERGTLAYQEPILWRREVWIVLIVLAVILCIIILLACCWCLKSRRRSEEAIARKNIMRASMNLQKKKKMREFESAYGSNLPSHESAIGSISATPLHAYGTSNYYSKRSHGSLDSPGSTNTYETTTAYFSGRTGETRTTETTTGRTTNDRTTTTDRTGTSRPTDYTRSESYYGSTQESAHIAPRRSMVNLTPNPYSEINTQVSTFQPNGGKVRMRPQSVHDTSCSSVHSSAATTPSSCSTCPTTDRDSTVTDGSWSEMSDGTVHKPLVPNRHHPGSNIHPSFSRAGTQRKDDVERKKYPAPRGSARFAQSPQISRSNPAIYSALPTIPSSIPPIESTVLPTTRHAPAPPRPIVPPRTTAPMVPPTRSLVDLYQPTRPPPQHQSSFPSTSPHSTRKPIVETTM
ncbi:unnamed protein product, partial [Mesorhabditis belari]|uniref:SRCR domain-containing protein n=1 Tax=Mesorhabditis belari TaxID=2138241 RepID=A0AAF3F479_9BILA